MAFGFRSDLAKKVMEAHSHDDVIAEREIFPALFPFGSHAATSSG
jgi:hypothetical protein